MIDLTLRPLPVRIWRTFRNYRRMYGFWDSVTATALLLWLNRRAKP